MKSDTAPDTTSSTRRNSRHGPRETETSFGSHSIDRPKQIKALLAMLTEYWRMNPSMQLQELLERLVPPGALPLDGPNRDDEDLIAALSAIPELQKTLEKSKPKQLITAQVAADSPDAQRLITIDVHLRQLHKKLLREHLNLASQLDQELDTGESSLFGYDINIRLYYLSTEPRPGQEKSRDPILAVRDVNWHFDIEEDSVNLALQYIDGNGYAEPGSSFKKGFLTQEVVGDAQGSSPALGEVGLLCADRVWVDFMVTRQYCLQLESGQFQTNHRSVAGVTGCNQT